MEVLKIGILGLVGVMLALQFKSTRPEIGIYIGFAVCIVLFSLSLDGLCQIMKQIEVLQQYMQVSGPYFKLLFKAVGITYICEFCAAVCKDAGHGAIAGQIEVFGKVSVLFLGLPILTAIVETISNITG
ncbi:MAG: stage III sporulation protein AD [Lachnospiraceae bacterium]|nr:stage III sporulation protein AD [Lachnospiraceae bacterium]